MCSPLACAGSCGGALREPSAECGARFIVSVIILTYQEKLSITFFLSRRVYFLPGEVGARLMVWA